MRTESLEPVDITAAAWSYRQVVIHCRNDLRINVHTQTADGFFGHFKTDVRGTHHSISRKRLLGYLNEWVWKWNRRDDDVAMFRQLIKSAALDA